MKRKTIEINGRSFELTNEHKCYARLCSGRNIWECYTRPSITKVEIYKDWLKWALGASIVSFGISAYNTHTFTLTGIYYDTEKGDRYFIRITPAHNYATLIS